VTERPRIALRQPRSLQPEQLGQLTVCTPAVPQRVRAWVVWEDGVEELVAGVALPGPREPYGSDLEPRPTNMRCGSGQERSSGRELRVE